MSRMPMRRSGETESPASRKLAQTFVWTFLAACVALVAIAAMHYFSVFCSEGVSQRRLRRLIRDHGLLEPGNGSPAADSDTPPAERREPGH